MTRAWGRYWEGLWNYPYLVSMVRVVPGFMAVDQMGWQPRGESGPAPMYCLPVSKERWPVSSDGLERPLLAAENAFDDRRRYHRRVFAARAEIATVLASEGWSRRRSPSDAVCESRG
jgi:hypothetical protein